MAKQTDSKTKVENLGKMPRLRFPEFQGKWETKEIGQLMKIGSGKDYKHLGEGDIPVFGTGGYMTSVNDYLMNGETICIGRKGTINKPFYHCGKFWTVDTLFYTHSFKNTIPRFALYIFEKINWLQYNEASGVPSLSKSTIEQIEISIPFLPEQKKIASLLSLIDERIECQRKIIQKMESLSLSFMRKIFSQQIRFKDKNGGNFPDWEIKKLGDIFYSEKGKGISKNMVIENGKYECVLYGELYTRYKEVIAEIVSKTDEYNGLKSQIGDLLLPSSTTTTGIDLANVTAINKENVLLGGDITVLRTKEKINNIFYAYYLSNHKKEEIASYAQGSTIVHLYYSHIKEMCIDIPSLEEQTKIANFLTSLDAKIETEKQLLEQYKQQKAYLLQNLFI